MVTELMGFGRVDGLLWRNFMMWDSVTKLNKLSERVNPIKGRKIDHLQKYIVLVVKKHFS